MKKYVNFFTISSLVILSLIFFEQYEALMIATIASLTPCMLWLHQAYTPENNGNFNTAYLIPSGIGLLFSLSGIAWGVGFVTYLCNTSDNTSIYAGLCVAMLLFLIDDWRSRNSKQTFLFFQNQPIISMKRLVFG